MPVPPFARARRGAAALAVATALAGPARAQSDEEVRGLFDQGVALLDQGRFADALERFRRVSAVRQTPAVLYNLALAERGVGRYLYAAAHFDAWLAVAAGRADPARVAEVRGARDECRAAVARLTLRPSSPALSLRVDDVTRDANAAIELDPGEHVVRASGDAFEPFEAAVTLRPGESRELAVAPRARDLRTPIRIEASVEDATVVFDGQLVGRGVYVADVLPGRHAVRVRAEGHAPWEGEVHVTAGRPERLQVVLDRRRPGVVEQWWFWTGVGVVVAGAGFALGYALRPTEAPLTGTLGVNVSALRFQ